MSGISHSPYASNNLALHVGDDADEVRKNRFTIEMLVGPTQYMNQSHGDVVAVVDGTSMHEPNADALVTTESGIALGVLVADCIPLLMWDEVEHVIAAVHVGRRGLLNGIAIKAVKIMNSFGADHVQAILGPSICGRCYEVSREIFDEVGSRFPASRSLTEKGTASLDLPGALAHELSANGVKITRSPICTAENSNFFSYRRDGITGRQAGLIWQ